MANYFRETDDEELLTIAIATRMLVERKDANISAVRGMVRRLHTDWDCDMVDLEARRIVRGAGERCKKMRKCGYMGMSATSFQEEVVKGVRMENNGSNGENRETIARKKDELVQGSFGDFAFSMLDLSHRHSIWICILLSVVTALIVAPLAYMHATEAWEAEWYACIPFVVLAVFFAVVFVCSVFHSLLRIDENDSNSLNELTFKSIVVILVMPLLLLLFLFFRGVQKFRRNRENICRESRHRSTTARS